MDKQYMIERLRDAYHIAHRLPAQQGQDILDAAGRSDQGLQWPLGTRDELSADICSIIYELGGTL